MSIYCNLVSSSAAKGSWPVSLYWNDVARLHGGEPLMDMTALLAWYRLLSMMMMMMMEMVVLALICLAFQPTGEVAIVSTTIPWMKSYNARGGAV